MARFTSSWRTPILVGAVVALLAAAGCDGSADKNTANQPSATGSGNVTASSNARSTKALPGKLPEFSSQDRMESDVRTIIQMAATYAVGVPSEDRSPKVVVTSDSSVCGVTTGTGIEACMVSADVEATITLSPMLAWANFQTPVARGGGLVATQDSAVASYTSYLVVRDFQRHHPAYLQGVGDSERAHANQTIRCKQGNVIGGLRAHGVMSAGLTALFVDFDKDPDFTKGTRGEC